MLTARARAAMDAADRGWAVFPLRPRRKSPPALHGQTDCPSDGVCATGHQGWEQRATTDPERIRACWNTGDFNVGIACGPSGLLVVDLDLPKPNRPMPDDWRARACETGEDVLAVLAERAGELLPVETFTVVSPSGSRHLYFTRPAGLRLGNTSGDRGRGLGPLIDTRGCGGYVVAAGSVVPTGTYQVAYDAPPAELPAWIASALSGPNTSRTPASRTGVDELLAQVRRRSAYAATALRRELDRLLAVRDGRNNALNAAAYSLGRLVGAGLLPRELVEQALTEAACALGLDRDPPAGQVARTIRSGLDSGERAPRQVPA